MNEPQAAARWECKPSGANDDWLVFNKSADGFIVGSERSARLAEHYLNALQAQADLVAEYKAKAELASRFAVWINSVPPHMRTESEQKFRKEWDALTVQPHHEGGE